MTQLCLVRHGETDWNYRGLVQGSTDIPLNEKGYEQAGEAGAYLKEYEWDFLYSSPLSRAHETAATIGRHIGLSQIHTDRRLQERNFGEAEGMEVSLRKELYRGRQIPRAETWEEVQARGIEVIDELALRHPDSRLMVVSHGGFIAGLLFLISKGDIAPGNPPLRNTCMNLLSYDGNWRIEWYNQVASEIERVGAK